MPRKGSGRRAVGRRGVLPGERQQAVSAQAAREQGAQYSDEFESDTDSTLNSIGKEFNRRNSGFNRRTSVAESTKKLVAVASPLSDEYASQKAADLEKEAADDSTLSFHEKKLPQTMLLEGENIQDDRKDGEEECVGSQNEDDNRKNNQECSAPEEAPCGNGESEHCNDLPIRELQKKRNQERNKAIPKPRERKTRNASASDHDQKTSTSDLEVEDNSGKSHSVTEVMKTTVYEKTKELEKSTDDSSDEMVKIAEGQIVPDTAQKASVNDQSEHGEAKSTSKDSVKETSEIKERALQNVKVSVSERCLSSAHLKKKVKAVASAITASPQYLGTLKVLENKRVRKNSTEFDKADSLRAAVFQNWLEKKRAALLQSKRIEKEKAENLRNNIEKKEAVRREEANAAFEAWKKKKAIEAKKLHEKKKLEELKEKKATEQNKEKAEAAQKKEAVRREEANAAFEAWKKKKAIEAKKLHEKKKLEELKEKKATEQNKEKAEAAQKKEAVRREEANAAFEAWKKKKAIEAKKLREKKKLEELKEKKATEQNKEKAEAAQKKEAVRREEANAAFEAWKKKKAIEAKKLREKKKLEELKEKKATEQNKEKAEAAQKKEAVRREEANAAFEAWKKKKAIEAKKLREKKKLEELKEKKATEQNKEKAEAAQKDDRKDGEEECVGSQNEDDNRKNNQECSAPEEAPCGNGESEHCNDLPIRELQKKRNQERNKAIPKPRERKTRNASASDGCSKPLPQPRNILRKSGPVEDNEGKTRSRKGLSSFSAPSSLTTLNTQAVPTKKLIVESPGPEGPWLESTSPPFSTNFTSHNERSGDSSSMICGEAPPAKGIGKEFNGRTSGAESTKKLVAVASPLSDEYASQKAADLEKEAADDSTLSFHEKKLPQTMLLESENIQDDRKDGEEECVGSQNEDDNRKNNQECSAPEEAPCGNGESEHCNDLPIRELQKKRNQERNKAIPKPRERKTRNASASGIGKEFNGRTSGAESTKKLVAVASPLSDEYASQQAADLEKEAADDSTLSFHEKKLPQTMLLESENIQDDRKDGEEECVGSQNEDDNRKNNQECSAPEEAPCGNGESEHCNDLPIRELQKKSNQERNKRRRKPRKRKTRNASASGIGKEFNGRTSGAESTKKLVAVASPLSDEYASQQAADLEKEAADDSTLSFHEKKLPQTMLLESENIQDDRKDGEEECVGSQNEDDNRKNNQECSAPEEAPCGNGESEHCNDLPIRELQKKSNQERNKRRRKPRKRKTRNASASGIGKEFNGRTSGAESTKKLVAVASPLSDEYASQQAADLEKEAADDSTLSFHEKKLPQTMLLESENIQDDRKDGEEECVGSQNEDDNRKNNQECSAPEEAPCGNGESEHCNDLPIRELQKKSNQERNKRRRKPRKRKTRNASASDHDQKTSTSDLEVEDNSGKSHSVSDHINLFGFDKV